MTSDINFTRRHHLDQSEAKRILQRVVARLDEKYDLDTTWTDDTVRFTKSGIKGFMRLSAGEVEVSIQLGGFYKALQPIIASELERKLDEYFPEDPA